MLTARASSHPKADFKADASLDSSASGRRSQCHRLAFMHIPPRPCLTFTTSSETTAVPLLVSLHTKGTLGQTRQIWRVSLVPLLCSLSSYVLVWAMTFFPRYIRRSATDERRLIELPDASTAGKAHLHSNHSVTHPTAFRCDRPQSKYFSM